MKYSIVIPTFNSKRWIQTSISSVLAQTLQAFDLIILDSGSTDGTVEWIESLNDSRIHIYKSESRLDIAENWARIVTIPRNEFMTIMGHDDILYSGYLDTIDKLIEENPEAVLFQTHFKFIDGKGELIRSCTPMRSRISPEDLLESVLKHTIEITATGFMIRSRDYDAIGGIAPYPKLLYADTELWLKLILKSYLAVARETCFEFRFHIENTSKTAGKVRLVAFEMMIEYLSQLREKDPRFKMIIDKNAKTFLKSYVIGACHKLIYVPQKDRDGVTMDSIADSARICAQKLIPEVDFVPENFPEVRLARLIDSSYILRKGFLFIKSLKKRTF